MGLALRHKMKHQKLAAENSSADAGNKPASALVNNQGKSIELTSKVPSEIQALKDGFSADLAIVKALHGDEQKQPVKAEMIDKYQPLVDYYFENFENFAHLDPIFYWLLWGTDILGLPSMANAWETSIENGLTSPEAFKRNVQDIYLDSVVVYFDECEDSEFERYSLESVIEKIDTGEYGTNSPLKAKLFKRFGLFKMREGELQDFDAAKKYFEKAVALDDRVGVKKLIKQIDGVKKDDTSEKG